MNLQRAASVIHRTLWHYMHSILRPSKRLSHPQLPIVGWSPAIPLERDCKHEVHSSRCPSRIALPARPSQRSLLARLTAFSAVPIIAVCLLSVSRASDCGPGSARMPRSISLGPVLLRPSGFLDLIGVARSATTPDNVSTDFGAIPLTSTSRDGLASVRHSRLMLQGETPVFSGTLSAYVEGDFLSPAGAPLWRLRQAWGEYRRGGWRVLGGQAWSLLRANQKGISSEKDLIDIDVIDPAYHVGLLGDRKQQVRVTRELSSGWLAAASYEEGGNFVAKAVRDRARLHLEALAFARGDGAWGGAAAAVIQATQRVSLLTQQFASDGAGREPVGGLPDGVRSYATIQGAEARLPHEMKLFAYAGLVYGARSEGNRVVREWTVGAKKNLFTYSTIGVASLAAHYSHVQRAVWSGPAGEMNYAMVSLRFTVPAP
jgi:hypothetical protein